MATITTYKNSGNEDDKQPTSVTIVSVNKTLTQWVIPDYVGTYAAQTIADEAEGYEEKEKISYLTIENNHRTIRFIYEYNFVKKGLSNK